MNLAESSAIGRTWASRAGSTAFPRSNLVWMRSPRSTFCRAAPSRLPEERRTSRRRTTRSIGICCTCRERPPDLTVGTSSALDARVHRARVEPDGHGVLLPPLAERGSPRTAAISSKRWRPSRRTRRARSGCAGARAVLRRAFGGAALDRSVARRARPSTALRQDVEPPKIDNSSACTCDHRLPAYIALLDVVIWKTLRWLLHGQVKKPKRPRAPDPTTSWASCATGPRRHDPRGRAGRGAGVC